MAQAAEAQGIPASAIFVEPQARDTIQNACYAMRIMKAHGWRSAEVVSSATHLPRAGLIFDRLPMEWRTHAAPPVEPESAGDSSAATMLETLKTLRYLLYGKWAERVRAVRSPMQRRFRLMPGRRPPLQPGALSARGAVL